MPWSLGVVQINHAQVNNEVLENFENKPVAIFLTGQSRWWEMMPMFEFNGEMEVIRKTDIPLFGVCGGHQMIAAQQERTFVQSTGRYHGAYEKDVKHLMEGDIVPIKIIAPDNLFAGMNDPFYIPKLHSWNICVIPDGFELIATSTDSNGHVVNEIIKHKKRLIIGSQGHPEISTPWSSGKLLLINFLRLAMAHAAGKTDGNTPDLQLCMN
ncbi:hypothetical protein JCM12294_24040 [Desulfocicer niacini]